MTTKSVSHTFKYSCHPVECCEDSCSTDEWLQNLSVLLPNVHVILWNALRNHDEWLQNLSHIIKCFCHLVEFSKKSCNTDEWQQNLPYSHIFILTCGMLQGLIQFWKMTTKSVILSNIHANAMFPQKIPYKACWYFYRKRFCTFL